MYICIQNSRSPDIHSTSRTSRAAWCESLQRRKRKREWRRNRESEREMERAVLKAQLSVYMYAWRSIEDRIPGHPQRSCSLILARNVLALLSILSYHFATVLSLGSPPVLSQFVRLRLFDTDSTSAGAHVSSLHVVSTLRRELLTSLTLARDRFTLTPALALSHSLPRPMRFYLYHIPRHPSSISRSHSCMVSRLAPEIRVSIYVCINRR